MEDGMSWPEFESYVYAEDGIKVPSPYGKPGDRLWVRETWTHNRVLPLIDRPDGDFIYRADLNENGVSKWAATWKPSIHMPRWASRINLEITGIRVERLQDISRDDAIAEGTDWKTCPTYQSVESLNQQRFAQKIGVCCFPVMTIDYIGGYRKLWESINGPGSWDANPWVWVVEFKSVSNLFPSTEKP